MIDCVGGKLWRHVLVVAEIEQDFRCIEELGAPYPTDEEN